MSGKGHRDLLVWQKGMALVTEIYRVTKEFPKDELYGLTNQLRRAAVSIPSNVAEGYARNSRNELHHFLGQARGSLAELETQIEIAMNLGYMSEQFCTTTAHGQWRGCPDVNRLEVLVCQAVGGNYQLLTTNYDS